MNLTSCPHVKIAIIGTGFAGLGAAIQLQKHGFYDYLLFERADDVGGVWRDNHYPGAACDVESHLYSFSFAPSPSWSHMFSRQPEILRYLQHCVVEFGLGDRIRYGHGVEEAAWNERDQRWVLDTTRGRYTADVVIAGMGGLSEPSIPALPGLSSYRGDAFHSARWRHDVDLRGKRVAVIGSGASAIQFVPAIVPEVEQLVLFQRTPAWVLPRYDREIGPLEQQLYSRFPVLLEASRALIYLRRELLVLGFRNPKLLAVVERFARRYLQQTVCSPRLRAQLTPNFRMGCKRILISSDYLPALTRPNVAVENDGVREVREHSIVTHEGREYPVDVIIFATGFQVSDPPFARHVRGTGGRTLKEVWNGSLESLRATTVAGFPNLFLLLGPNSGVGHTSVLQILEAQLTLLIEALSYMRDERLDVLEPRAEAQARFMAELQQKMEGTVWLEGGCASWYLDARGRATTLWPSFTFEFRRRAHFIASEYDLWCRSTPSSTSCSASEQQRVLANSTT